MPYSVTQKEIPDVLVLTPRVFEDPRGFFFESFNQREFEKSTGLSCQFVQDNHSKSSAGVLRGLHYQLRHPQGKLVRVLAGAIYDVAVDLRPSSGTFGQWVCETLTAEKKNQLWVPAGFAHGFLVLSENAEVAYKTTDYWHPEDEHSLLWSDPSLAIPWPIVSAPLVAEKDRTARGFAETNAAILQHM